MAQFQRHFVQDLTKPIIIRQCVDLGFTGDNLSDVISVDLYTDGEAYSGGGTCAGACICPDGSSVALTGTVSGKTASVTLTEDCFAIPGQIGIGIRVTTGTTKTTVLKAIYNVEQFATNNPVDPGSRIALDVSDLINRIDAAVESIPASADQLKAAMAPNFSDTTPYPAGAYVWNNGTLYKFTTAHAAGSWTGTDATAVALGNDVADLKSTFGELPNINLFNKSSKTVGYIKQDGTETDTATWNKTDYMPIDPRYPYYYQGIATPGGAPYSAFYNSSKVYLSSFKQGSGANMLPAIPSNAAFVRFSVHDTDLNTFKFYNGFLPDFGNHYMADKKIIDQVVKIGNNRDTSVNITWENGSISNGVDNLISTGIKSTYIPLFGQSFKTRATVAGLTVYLAEYDVNYNYLETHSTGGTFISPVNANTVFVRVATYSTTIAQSEQKNYIELYWKNTEDYIAPEVFNIFAENYNYLTDGGLEIVSGSYVDLTGNIASYANTSRTVYIPVVAGTKIKTISKMGTTGQEVAYYDKNKVFLPDPSIVGDGTLHERTLTVPTGAEYVIVSAYEFYTLSVNLVDEKTPEKDYIGRLTECRSVKNLKLRPSQNGYYYSVNSFANVTDDSAWRTGYIPVIPGETIKYSTNISNSAYELIFYNKVMGAIPSVCVVGNASATEKTLAVPADAYYAELFYYGGSPKNAYIMLLESTEKPDVSPYGFYIAKNTGGYYNGPTFVSHVDGRYSDPIPVGVGTVIEYQLFISLAGNELTFFDKDMNYVDKVLGNSSKAKKIYTVENDAFAYVVCCSYDWCGTINVYKDSATYEAIRRKDVFNGGFNSFATFRKFCVIGDSLSVGCTNYPDGTITNRELNYCWGAFIARKYNSVCVNRGFTGATAESWLTQPLGYAEFNQASTKSQAYIIALGANEQAANIGSPETIDDTTTYYGAYKAIYDAVRVQNADAIVFMFTLPTKWGQYETVNTAIRWIAENVGDSNTFLVDLWEGYRDYFNSEPIYSTQKAHFYSNGYQLISNVICHALDSIILANPDNFAYVPKIDYTT